MTIALRLCIAFGITLVAILGTPGFADKPTVPDNPTIAELFAARVLPEPLVPVGSPSEADNFIVARVLHDFERRSPSDDFTALENFAGANPSSPWRLAVLTNLGLLQYRAGYFSKCLPTFRAAWDAGKETTEIKAKALADRAAGEYTKMLARLGRYEELKSFLEEVKDREFVGPARGLILAGREGCNTMEKRPEVAFRCGPLALSRILASQNSSLWAAPDIVNARSTMEGLSLESVAELSRKVGLNFQPAKRTPGATFIFPSVIHWKVGHYAALLRKEEEHYLTEDPTFDNETSHSLEALESEASGYFLVPSGPLPSGWISVDPKEAALIFGKGMTDGGNSDDTGDDDHDPDPPCKPGSPGAGMAIHSFHTMLASLKITDTPVGYQPPFGYPAYFTVNYTQREATQPSNFNFTNLGPKWNINWLSYVTDNPSSSSAPTQNTPKGGRIKFLVTVASGGGGGASFIFFNPQKRKQIERAQNNPIPYTITNPDGSKDIFGQPDGSTVAPRKVFLTQRIDPAGNVTTLTYDAQLRISAITDALGQQMVLSYELPGDPYKITKVTDPFGRFATFEYDASGRLIKIRDVIGIQSVFTYAGAGDFVNSLTTPYGTTTFAKTESGSIRRVVATDPAGDSQVLETNHLETPAISFTGPADQVPQGMAIFNSWLSFRNSFFWNKKQWKEAPNDYSKSHIYHWMHDLDFSKMSGTLESEKPPLRSRIWYSYPGQSNPFVVGAQIIPSVIGHAVEGGSQITRGDLNDLGFPTSVTDPMGRVTDHVYAGNNIDLLSTTQQVAGAPVTLGTYTWNANHRPLTFTDGAGQVTTYSWNTTGQLTSITNAKNEITAFAYFSANVAGKQRKGRLSQINGALAGNSDVVSFDYDATGNVAQVTGPDGYSLSFLYDALDRLTRVTFPDSTYTETTYSRLDPLTSRDRLGRLTQYVYNSIRQLVSVTDPGNRTIQYRWCKCGDLAQLIDAMGRITSWRHDVASRVTAKQYADGSKIAYDYEPLSGRLSRITDEKGQVKTRSYNLDNTLAGIAYTHEEHETPDVAFTYETDFRRLASMVDGIGTTLYAYHPIAPGTLGAGRLASVDGPLPADTLTYAYDELARNTGYAINAVGETRTFDPLGRLLSAVNPLGTFGYTYVGATSRMDTVTYPNGMICQYNYHPPTGDFRLQDIIHILPGNIQLSRHSYTYNAVGNIIRWTQISPQAGLNRSWLCGYDDADQLTSVTSQHPDTLATLPTGHYGYTYDFAGNRLTETIDGVTTTAHSNALNQLTSLTTAGASTLPPQTYEWDAEDRLEAINYNGTIERTEFEYDGFGRRVGVREKQGASVIGYRRYAWRGFKIAEEREGTGSVVQRRYFARGMQTSGAGGALDICMVSRDHLGSVRQVVSTTPELTSAYDFDPWGKRSMIVGQSDESGLAFTGHLFHSRSSLTMAPFRSYNPSLGLWLSRDRLGERKSHSLSLSAYVDNNPVSKNDASGLASGDWKGVACALFMILCPHPECEIINPEPKPGEHQPYTGPEEMREAPEPAAEAPFQTEMPYEPPPEVPPLIPPWELFLDRFFPFFLPPGAYPSDLGPGGPSNRA